MSASTKDFLLLLVVLALIGFVFPRIWQARSAETPLADLPSPAITESEHTLRSSPPPLNKELAPLPPWQSSTPASPNTYKIHEYQLTELAYFDTTSLVLSVKKYPRSELDKEAHRNLLSPMDIAIGWGAMSNPEVLSHFRYYQSDRFFHFANYLDYTTQASQMRIDELVANIHIIPASRAIADALENVRPHTLVRLVGSLVEVRQVKGNYKSPVIWRSSLSRLDLGDGACEVLYLKRLEWKDLTQDEVLSPRNQ
jgi:hypothetical protein